MQISIFKSTKTGVEQLNIIEAFNIWNFLRSRYTSIETFQFFLNFIHDRDFKLLTSHHLHDFDAQVKVMEKLAEKLKVNVPSRPAKEVQFSHQIDQVTDRFIYRKFFSDFLAELQVLINAYRTTTTNDGLRSELRKFLLNHMDNYQELYKFGKFKAWNDVEPAYKTARMVEVEPLSVSEAYHIWEHLSYRYDQIHLTSFYLSFVHDKDFKMLLMEGVSILKNQSQILENLAAKYEIMLPERPPSVVEASVDPEILEDRFVHRTIFTGIQGAVELHVRAVLETIRNDSLREILLGFLKKELDAYDGIIKYGNAKGWSLVMPMYRAMT